LEAAVAKKWVITEWDGFTKKGEGALPGHLTESEVFAALQRLACRYLNFDEVLAASRRKNDDGYSSLLERIGQGSPISCGESPRYTAELDE
jgi:hypothetical protein